MAKHLAPKKSAMPRVMKHINKSNIALVTAALIAIGGVAAIPSYTAQADTENLHPKPFVTRTIQNALDD